MEEKEEVTLPLRPDRHGPDFFFLGAVSSQRYPEGIFIRIFFVRILINFLIGKYLVIFYFPWVSVRRLKFGLVSLVAVKFTQSCNGKLGLGLRWAWSREL